MAGRLNIVQNLTNQELVKRYRFGHDDLHYLEQTFGAILQPKTMRGISLTAMEKILIGLRYLASGEIQLNDGDIHHVSQPCISKTIAQFLESVVTPANVRQFIKFPTSPREMDFQAQQFGGLAGFPKVIGVIDGTHVKILAPSFFEDAYVNRKGFHSINVQVVSDVDDKITNIVARWPGSTHDARILQESGLATMFQTGLVPEGYHILGDSGYPCKRWLLTPYLNPQPGAQSSYNRSHKITRSKVERCIGQLKRRFGVLHGEIRMEPVKACRVITACAILHNICKERNIPLPDLPGPDDTQDMPDPALDDAPAIGLRYRDHFANRYFN